MLHQAFSIAPDRLQNHPFGHIKTLVPWERWQRLYPVRAFSNIYQASSLMAFLTDKIIARANGAASGASILAEILISQMIAVVCAGLLVATILRY